MRSMIAELYIEVGNCMLRNDGNEGWRQNKPSVTPVSLYQREGIAKANILLFSGWTCGITSEIEKFGDKSYPRILELKSTMPRGVAGDAEEAGDVVVE